MFHPYQPHSFVFLWLAGGGGAYSTAYGLHLQTQTHHHFLNLVAIHHSLLELYSVLSSANRGNITMVLVIN